MLEFLTSSRRRRGISEALGAADRFRELVLLCVDWDLEAGDEDEDAADMREALLDLLGKVEGLDAREYSRGFERRFSDLQHEVKSFMRERPVALLKSDAQQRTGTTRSEPSRLGFVGGFCGPTRVDRDLALRNWAEFDNYKDLEHEFKARVVPFLAVVAERASRLCRSEDRKMRIGAAMRIGTLVAATLALAIGLGWNPARHTEAEEAQGDANVEAPQPRDDDPVVPPAAELDVSYFYDALSADGTWVQDRTYGWVWQPAVVVQDVEWRPYSDAGRWVWTDEGWYWESDYRWGWAAFHYGRWCRHDSLRWIWVPDVTWAPAWVSWRDCDTHYGWAPLPPGCEFRVSVGAFFWHGARCAAGFEFGLVAVDFCFVPCAHFCDRDHWRHRCDGREGVVVYNKTVVNNNTYVVNNGKIVNNGVRHEQVENRVGHKVEQQRIKPMNLGEGQRIREKHVGNNVHVYRPEIKNKTRIDPPAANKNRQQREEKRQAEKPPQKPRQEQPRQQPQKPERRQEQPQERKREPRQEQPRQPPVERRHEQPPIRREAPPRQPQAPSPHHEAPPPQHHHQGQPPHHKGIEGGNESADATEPLQE